MYEPIDKVIPTPKKEPDEHDPLAKIKEDLMQPLEPQEVLHISPFNGITWKEKLNSILEKLLTYIKSRENQIKALEAYYYLGILIEENKDHHVQIKERIQQVNGTRKTRDIWKGAHRI